MDAMMLQMKQQAADRQHFIALSCCWSIWPLPLSHIYIFTVFLVSSVLVIPVFFFFFSPCSARVDNSVFLPFALSVHITMNKSNLFKGFSGKSSQNSIKMDNAFILIALWVWRKRQKFPTSTSCIYMTRENLLCCRTRRDVIQTTDGPFSARFPLWSL